MADTFKNSYKVAEKEMVSLSVYNVGFQQCDPLYQWGPGVRDHYLIHYIVSGRGVYTVGGQQLRLAAGDVFLVYPGTTVTYASDKAEPWEYYWVGFNGSDAAHLLSATDFLPENPVVHAGEWGDLLRQQLFAIYEARGNSLSQMAQMTGRLYLALSLFLSHTVREEVHADALSIYVRQATEYIGYRYSYPITVDDIAAYVGISRSHLYRAFRAVLGQSPKTYLSKYRIRQACALLGRPELTVASIAQSVGYESGLYFSKVFHKLKGMTPTEFMRQVRLNEATREPPQTIPPT
ncbi:MAG: AraC family ligand binding domain-containing protein [Acutalibacteraceae bacterium]|jgi:AraC-like DNA-binding protein